MKNSMKFLVGGLAAVVVLGAAYFGAGGGLQGKIALNEPIMRAELMKLVAVVISDKLGDMDTGCSIDEGVYTDVKKENWSYPYICYLYKKELLSGKPIFSPFSKVNRAEAAKIFAASFDEVKDPNGMISFAADAVAKLPAPYSDVADSNQWYFFPVYRVASLGIADVKGFVNTKFYPAANLTKGRAQYWADNLKKALNK